MVLKQKPKTKKYIFTVEEQWVLNPKKKKYVITACNLFNAFKQLAQEHGEFDPSEIVILSKPDNVYEVPDRLVIELVAVL